MPRYSGSLLNRRGDLEAAPEWPSQDRRLPGPVLAELLFYSGLFIATLAFGYAALARVLGLAHLGQKVDLIERLIRRGQGDPKLAAALRRDEEGDPTK